MSSTKRYFRVAYSNIRDDSKNNPLHQVRDGMAFCELGALFPPRGYEFATTIHLYKQDKRTIKETTNLKTNDMLVLTTRPPLDDPGVDVPEDDTVGAKRFAKQTKKIVPQNGGELEKAIFAALRPYLRLCTRRAVVLGDRAKQFLKKDYERFADMDFAELLRSNVLRFYGTKGKSEIAHPPPVEVAFFFSLDLVLDRHPCKTVVSFGMDGLRNLLWNRLVRMRHPEWLDTKRFVMAALRFRKMPGDPFPMTPEFIDEEDAVELTVVAEEPLRSPRSASSK